MSIYYARGITNILERIIKIDGPSNHARTILVHSACCVGDVSSGCEQKVFYNAPAGFASYTIVSINTNIQNSSRHLPGVCSSLL